MNLFLVLVLINYAAGELAGDGSSVPFYRSDYTFVEQHEGWFKFHRAPVPWHQARRRCEYEGAQLATPMNKGHVEMFRELMSTADIPAMFTGAHATFSHADYYTVDGIPYMDVSRSMWQSGGLTYSKSDRCASIDHFGLLTSVGCEEALPFLCFKKFAHLVTNECGTTDREYVFEKTTGSCYKLHRTARDWTTAFEVCSAEGGYLAVPFDAEEAQVLSGIASSDSSFIGLTVWDKSTDRGEWFTVHGKPLTYTRWDRPAGSMRHCGAIQNSSNMIQRVFCDMEKTFICEKDPDSLTMHRTKPAL